MVQSDSQTCFHGKKSDSLDGKNGNLILRKMIPRKELVYDGSVLKVMVHPPLSVPYKKPTLLTLVLEMTGTDIRLVLEALKVQPKMNIDHLFYCLCATSLKATAQAQPTTGLPQELSNVLCPR